MVSGQWSVGADGEPFSVSVKWNRTGSVGRLFFRRGRTLKIAEVMAGEFSNTNDTNHTNEGEGDLGDLKSERSETGTIRGGEVRSERDVAVLGWGETLLVRNAGPRRRFCLTLEF